MLNQAQERHNIRKMDRLLGNTKLHEELILFYQKVSHTLLAQTNTAVISVDWSATDKCENIHILRASISLQGRSQVMYEEVHEQSALNQHHVHKQFLSNLKHVLPEHVHAIIITDAGFCNPWFKEVQRLGYDWIGRTKSTVQYSNNAGKDWENCRALYDRATKNDLDPLLWWVCKISCVNASSQIHF